MPLDIFMADTQLISDLQQQVLALRESAESLAGLARRLPKHGRTVDGLSRALHGASQFIRSVAVHVERDPTAA